MNRLAKPTHKLDLNDNKRREKDKIHQDEMDSYQVDPTQDDVVIPEQEFDKCPECGTEVPKGDLVEMYSTKGRKSVCDECANEITKNDLSEEEKAGKEQAEKVQQEYGLSNSYNADEIEEPHLRNYVQALLSYYNSWGDYDGGYTKHCERALERASEELGEWEEEQKKQKNKKANRIITRLQKMSFRTPDFSDDIDLALDVEGVAKSLNDLAKKVKGIEDFNPDDVTQFSQILEQISQDVQALVDIADDQANGSDPRINKTKPYSGIW